MTTTAKSQTEVPTITMDYWHHVKLRLFGTDTSCTKTDSTFRPGMELLSSFFFSLVPLEDLLRHSVCLLAS